MERNFSNKVTCPTIFKLTYEMVRVRMSYERARVQKQHDQKFEKLKPKEWKRRPALTNEKWVVNLTDVDIPQNVRNVLGLGPKFCFPSKVPVDKIVMDTEHVINMSKASIEKKEETRHRIAEHLKRITQSTYH